MIINTNVSRQALRAAVKIHEHLLGPAQRPEQVALPQAAWQEVCQIVERLRYVERRGWQTAAQALHQDLHYAAGCLQREIELLRHRLAPNGTPPLDRHS